MKKSAFTRGYTLIELMVAVGLFAIIMTLASGAYLVLINVNRQTQAVATGIDNLSFVLETMTRDIRTGTHYNCNNSSGGNCASGANSFYFTNSAGQVVSYARSTSSTYCGTSGTGCVVKTVNSTTEPLTDPAVDVASLTFYASGVYTTADGDYQQPRVTMVISGTVLTGPAKSEPFTIETSATMRGSDI